MGDTHVAAEALATTAIGIVVTVLFFKHAAIDAFLEARFNRLFGVDTGAVKPAVVAARRAAWWAGTQMSLLRMCVPAVFLVALTLRVFFIRVFAADFPDLEHDEAQFYWLRRALVYNLGPAFLLLLWFSKTEEHTVMLYRAMTVGIPAVRFYFGMYPPTGDMCFTQWLPSLIFLGTYLGVFMGPSFSAFARHASSAEHFFY